VRIITSKFLKGCRPNIFDKECFDSEESDDKSDITLCFDLSTPILSELLLESIDLSTPLNCGTRCFVL
jgi:hypothetical protein